MSERKPKFRTREKVYVGAKITLETNQELEQMATELGVTRSMAMELLLHWAYKEYRAGRVVIGENNP